MKKHLKLENRIPDACTFRNVIKAIDTQQLHEVFVEQRKMAKVQSRRTISSTAAAA